MEFRTLKPNEIEIRAARCNEKGAQFLLYKDARVDMNILDETVGPERWQRRHNEHNGNLFCEVGIKTEGGEWIWKEDAGAESNTEAEKGHASDSFKRACVNWGIGRELYTSPHIWISGCTEEYNKRYVLKRDVMNLKVDDIKYDENRNIIALTISNGNGIVYRMGDKPPKQPENNAKPASGINTATTAKTSPAANLAGESHVCVKCGSPINDKVYNYSLKYYRKALCMNCQKDES